MAAYIDEDLVVKIGDAELRFEHPGDRVEAIIKNVGKHDGVGEFDEDLAIDQVVGLLKSVTGLKRKEDESDVTLDEIKGKVRCSKAFLRGLMRLYFREMRQMASGEHLLAGNAPTPAS